MKRVIIFLLSLFLFLYNFNYLMAQGKKRGRPRVIQLEEITIEGKVQKPNAFYVLTRSNLAFDKRELKKSFIKEVIRAVNKKPF